MGMMSLYVFTLLGGIAAAYYVINTCMVKAGKTTQSTCAALVTLVLFALGLIAATTHVHSFAHIFEALSRGTVNAGAMMIWEVALSGVFFVFVVIDTIISLLKKTTPFAVQVIGAVFGVLTILMMGAAYSDIFGNPIWSSAFTTVLMFVTTAFLGGFILFAFISHADFSESLHKGLALGLCALTLIALVMEIVAFSSHGASVTILVIAAILATVVPAVLVFLHSKFANKKILAIALLIVVMVGIAMARYAFYMTSSLF